MEYIVYIKTNKDCYITSINSSKFLSDTTGWVAIDKGYGDRYRHAQSNYFNKHIITNGGAYRYKLVDNNVLECSNEEIIQQEESNKMDIPTTSTLEDRVSYLEKTINTTMTEYGEALQELGVEL